MSLLGSRRSRPSQPASLALALLVGLTTEGQQHAAALRIGEGDEALSTEEAAEAHTVRAKQQDPTWLPNVGIYTGTGAWMDSTMVDNYNDLINHYKGVKDAVRRKRHERRQIDGKDDDSEEDYDYGHKNKLHAHALNQLTDTDSNEADQKEKEESTSEDEEYDYDEEYEKKLERHMKKEHPGEEKQEKRHCLQCWEAKKSEYPAGQCNGYEQVGFICLQDQCAACNPTGENIEQCAKKGPPGSFPDAFTGRCVVDNETTTTAAPGASKGGLTELFDCQDGVMKWKTAWSLEKQAYCCEHHQLGCSDALMQASSEDSTGKEGKRAWGTGRLAPAEECHRDLDDFERRWVDAKKEYCCKHFQLGCVEHARAIDQASSHSLQEIGAHVAGGREAAFTASKIASLAPPKKSDDAKGVPDVLVEMFDH